MSRYHPVPISEPKHLVPRLTIQKVEHFGSHAYVVFVDGEERAFMESVGNTGWKVEMPGAPSRHNRDIERAPFDRFKLTPFTAPNGYNLKESHHRSKEMAAYAVLSAVNWTPAEWVRYDDARSLADMFHFGRHSDCNWNRCASEVAVDLNRLAHVQTPESLAVQSKLMEAQRLLDQARLLRDQAFGETKNAAFMLSQRPVGQEEG